MISDPEARIRAILLMLIDLDPQMPILEAFGYIQVVEANLAAKEAQRRREAASRTWPPPF